MVSQARLDRSRFLLRLLTVGITALVRPFVAWHRNNEAKRHLSLLDDRMLQDIGLDPIDVRRSASFPMAWQ